MYSCLITEPLEKHFYFQACSTFLIHIPFLIYRIALKNAYFHNFAQEYNGTQRLLENLLCLCLKIRFWACFLFSREQWGYQGTGHAASSKNCKCLRLANEGSSDRTKVGTGLGVLLKAFSKKLGNIKGTRNFTTWKGQQCKRIITVLLERLQSCKCALLQKPKCNRVFRVN